MPHFDIFYMKPDFVRDGLMGYNFLKVHGKLPMPKALGATHIYLKMLEAQDLADVFLQIPMCVGDVVVSENGAVHIVDITGFEQLTKTSNEEPTLSKTPIETVKASGLEWTRPGNEFMRFWKAVNQAFTDRGQPELLYGDARAAYDCFTGKSW